LCFEVKFAGAEVGFLFLDRGVALADSGVARAADDVVDAIEEVEIRGFVDAGEGEFERGLFEDVKRGFGEFVVGVGRELEDLGGSGGGFGCVFELFDDGDVVAEKSPECACGYFVSEFFADEVAGFIVLFGLDPDGDLGELFGGEDGQGGFGVMPPCRSVFRRRALSTRIRRIASPAAPTKCLRSRHFCPCTAPPKRIQASCTSAVGCNVRPGDSRAIFAAASCRSSPYTSGKSSSAACGSPCSTLWRSCVRSLTFAQGTERDEALQLYFCNRLHGAAGEIRKRPGACFARFSKLFFSGG
jgi:hypothetical protein